MSWLVNTLKQTGISYAESLDFKVGPNHLFALVYNPDGGPVGETDWQQGSLAIVQQTHGQLAVRYKLYIQNASGTYVQWGDAGDDCYPDEDTYGHAFGPDVTIDVGNGLRPTGIFGLTHKELLQSEWVSSDTLTVKCEIEVRPPVDGGYVPLSLSQSIHVPRGSLGSNLASLLDDAKYSDITFIVQGESLKAHSQILCARSEVFETQLNSGLRESLSKEIVVEDCDLAGFRVLLNFLYTDDFSCVDEMVKAATASSSCESESASNARMSLLQNVLAASHRYQVVRLRSWCEHQLCGFIRVNDVLSVLCQAHLYEAKQLEEACLSFIKKNMNSVVVTSKYGSLSNDWPEVMLKISIYTTGVSESSAGPALEAQREAVRGVTCKRKRGE